MKTLVLYPDGTQEILDIDIPEPEPVPEPGPTLDERVTALETAITRGLSL